MFRLTLFWWNCFHANIPVLDLWKEKNVGLGWFIVQQVGGCLTWPNALHLSPTAAYRIRISIACEGLVGVRKANEPTLGMAIICQSRFSWKTPIRVCSLRPHLLPSMHCKKSRAYEMKATLNAGSHTTTCAPPLCTSLNPLLTFSLELMLLFVLEPDKINTPRKIFVAERLANWCVVLLHLWFLSGG